MLTMNEFKEAVTKDFKRFLDESFKDKEMVMYLQFLSKVLMKKCRLCRSYTWKTCISSIRILEISIIPLHSLHVQSKRSFSKICIFPIG